MPDETDKPVQPDDEADVDEADVDEPEPVGDESPAASHCSSSSAVVLAGNSTGNVTTRRGSLSFVRAMLRSCARDA